MRQDRSEKMHSGCLVSRCFWDPVELCILRRNAKYSLELTKVCRRSHEVVEFSRAHYLSQNTEYRFVMRVEK